MMQEARMEFFFTLLKVRHVLKNKLNIGREIVIMRCQRVFNGVDGKGNKPVVVNFQVCSQCMER